MMVYELLRRVQSLLIPPTCALCAASGEGELIDMCIGCANDLPSNTSACARCGERLTGAAAGLICGACLRRAPRYHSTHCAFRYSYPVDHLVRALKYHGRLANARLLGTLLAKSLSANRDERWPDLIVPVPLAGSRFAERGYNQASEIAKHVASNLDVPLRLDIIDRKRATREQAGLDRIGRRKNVRGAFALRHALTAKHVAIVDDVITTGSTVNEMARVLSKAGAEYIEVWAVARASR